MSNKRGCSFGWMQVNRAAAVCIVSVGLLALLAAWNRVPVWSAEPAAPAWKYEATQLRPFWEGDVVEGESLLFLRDEKTETASASLLFPVTEVLAVRNSAGDVTFERGRDYEWKAGMREIVLPAGSRIPAFVPKELRRPAKSQKYELTHRDGDGEIFFGGALEYAAMQTCVTYRHGPTEWKSKLPKFDRATLPRTVARLAERQPLKIVMLGDSISAGANASALYNAPPYQPAFPELVRRHLAERFKGQVELKNLAVGGTDTGWGLKQVDAVVAEQPHLVLLAFGMNDSAGRDARSYRETTKAIMDRIRAKLPECEFVLIASMLGNRDWIRLKHDVFPQYRDALQELSGPGAALADLTSIWTEFLARKKDWDQTGNGVNHPNDFGHRVYAQVITSLLDARDQPN